ncbi:hypothetical protein ACN47E_004001 [Coniothyrium glycines]
MFTRSPRTPNVKSIKHLPLSNSVCSLARAAAPRVPRPPIPTLKLPSKFFVPENLPQGDKYKTHKSQYHVSSANNMDTQILLVDPQRLGNVAFDNVSQDWIDSWDIKYSEGSDFGSLQRAARELVETDVPVAFPTETVYGLGADATRSSAVKAIFAAKGRPADNPLIVHFHSLSQLRALLHGKDEKQLSDNGALVDPVPEIYKPVIERFWPGPITIILPAPHNSVLAPEVTAGLTTFGARMPRSILALSLLRLCGCPLAAPSANVSTRPSPTAAEHVLDDLQGRISTIIDGGPCEVGVESTVVDGLSTPPSILRPGGITVEQLRQCPGWESVVVGYKDKQQGGTEKPRAPGMKYRHYSPKAEVFLFEAGAGRPVEAEVLTKRRVGIIRTKSWAPALGLPAQKVTSASTNDEARCEIADRPGSSSSEARPGHSSSNLLRSLMQHRIPHAEEYAFQDSAINLWEVNLGANTEDVARGIFSALRELDRKGVETIFVEGIDDKSGDDIAAAVMNRLRKAAEVRN